MTRSCRFAFGSRAGAAEWVFDGGYLTLSPDDGSPLSVALQEIAGITGDGYTMELVVPGAAPAGGATGGVAPGSTPAAAAPADTPRLSLSRLGSDGPTLLEELRREWLAARTKVLRLGGSGEGRRFSGRVDGLDGGAAEPFQALLFEDVLVVAREGQDLDPLFLALLDSVEFDEAGYLTRVRLWPGQQITFSKLAGQTDEFVKAVRAHRALLAKESATLLGAAAPALPAAGRASLAGVWLPGRLMEVGSMDSMCAGFAAAFAGAWLSHLARAEEGRFLLDRAAKASGSGGARSIWLGFARGDADGEAGDEAASDAVQAGAAEAGAAQAGAVGAMIAQAMAAQAGGAGAGTLNGASVAAPGGDAEQAEQPLWMLAGNGNTWFLEALSIGDRATYCFKGGDEVPVLVSKLLCAPQFSKEALYSPLDQLTGDSAQLAIPAQFLRFLVDLRKRFAGRVIHQTPDGWQKGVEKLVGV